MKKNIFIMLIILVFWGCSEKEPLPKTPVKDKVEVRVTKAKVTVPVEFVPEHIRKSKIEVVKHY